MKKQQHSKHVKIVKYTQKQIKQLKDKTDYKRLNKLSDNEIDYSDIPEKDKEFWAQAKIYDPGPKKAISLRIDEDVLSWFKHQGGRYQRLMNQVLRQYMNAH